MYAIVETGGKQYRVQPGDTIAVERLAGEPGETLDLDRVLLIGGDGERARVGLPGVEGAVVRAEVVEHARGEKIIVFRYKSKVRYRRKTGHRQALTRLRITDILVGGKSATPAPRPAAAEAEATPAPRRRRAAAAAAAPEESAASTETTPTTPAAPAPPTPAAQAASAEAAADTADEEMPAAAAEAGPPPDEPTKE
jgi:large subunit ribosomal protein L21